MLVFGLTVAFSINMAMFSTLRFFEGFCLAGIILSLYVLRIELCLPDWRFSMTMVATFVLLGGQLLMPGLAIMCGDWQVLQAVIICPLLLMLTYVWLFPESLRWLLATQQFSRAKRLITQIDKKNAANLEKEGGELLIELQQALQKKPKKTCIVKMVGTRNLWKNIVVLCVNSLTGYGIHHCFARSMIEHELQQDTMFQNFYAQYYTMAGIAVASCLALCPAVGMMGRRGGLLMFMIITALASLLQLGLLNLLGKYSAELNIESTDDLKSNFSVVFSIIGMFSSHAVSNLSIFFCAEITPTVIRGGGLGLVLASAGFGMLTAPIMELHNQKGYFLHHVIFACCTLICIICILLLPETRYQPLPESLADGESYTRQPLLPPRKPGEQRLLLTRTGSRVYDRVQDTPPHGGAAATINSTASSAVDLTLPSGCADEEMPAPDATPLFRKEDKPATTPTTERPTSEPNEAEHPAAGASELTQLTSPMDTSSPLLIGAVRPSRLTNQTPPTRTLAEAGSPSPVPPPPLDPTDSSLPAVDSALHVDSTFDLSPTAETTTPLLHAPQPPAPVESSTHILPDLSRDPAAVLVNGLVPSSTEGSGSPVPDSLPPIVHTPPPVLPATPSMIPSVPPPVSSSNADSAPETEESSPLVGAAPPSTVTLSTSLLQDSIVFSGTDPLPVPAQSFSLDCTVSSPIDSGLSVAESSASS
uniref:Solute carrier family 22 member 23 n=2 Tax=Denticeps clupeoides TaxID=299321 RepID=A0AAY4E3N7_9TELE